MLAEHETRLIAAAVDGELSAEESRAAFALLARSPAAVELHAALLRDRDRLRAIPRAAAPTSLAEAIAESLANRPMIVPRVRSTRRPRWVPAALAASVLTAVASGTYWLVSESSAPRHAKHQLQQLPKEGTRLVPSVAPDREKLTVEPMVVEAVKPIDSPMPIQPAAVATKEIPTPKTNVVETAIEPDRLLAAPVGSDVKAFDRVELRLPLLATMADFSRESTRGILTTNLQRSPATRIDAFAKDTVKAAELLVASARKLNVAIQVEFVAGERMKRRMPSAWWIYIDALTPDEIAKWLAGTAEADAAHAPADRVFGAVHAIPAGIQEQKDAHALAGIELNLGKAPAPSGGHISSKTLDQVTESLRKVDAPMPGLLLTYLPHPVRVPPQLSKSVKQFHELRGARKPGAVPLVLVVRPAQ